ncbi:MAG: hypothetical protein MUC49_14005 [Raineya sp.]|nr:hypothetical protein [Raineya sp.]
MKKIIILIFSLFLSLTTLGQSRYILKYNTITHRLLKLERQFSNDSLHGDFDKKYQIIDTLIATCKNRLSVRLKNPVESHIEGVEILKTIDSILSENNFFICIETGFLSEALTPTSKDTPLKCYIFNNNSYRKKMYEQAKIIYRIDCDLGSFIYLGIGEALGLPLTLVEVPKHNFIRWKFRDGTHINWDVNSADFFSDEDFRNGLSPTAHSRFTKETEIKFGYLQSMDSSNTIGYYSRVVGYNFEEQKKYLEARKYYELAIEKWPYHPTPKFYLAYLIISYPVFNKKEDCLLANKLAIDAVVASPKDNEYLKILACSYALLGDFKMAIRTAKQTNPINSKLIEAFKNKKTGLDFHKPIN